MGNEAHLKRDRLAADVFLATRWVRRVRRGNENAFSFCYWLVFILAAAASTTQSKHAMTNNQINQPAEPQS